MRFSHLDFTCLVLFCSLGDINIFQILFRLKNKSILSSLFICVLIVIPKMSTVIKRNDPCKSL